MADKARPSLTTPQPPSISPEEKAERWRIATELAEALQRAGFSCQVSGPGQRASVQARIERGDA